MVRLNKIYTRTGDDGTTGLGDGSRLPKHHLRIQAYGTVDELSSVLGLVLAHGAVDERLAQRLRTVQNELFDAGAELCMPDDASATLKLTPEYTARLERWLDELNEGLEPLTSFILPGGQPLAAWLHLARTVCRRAERIVVALVEAEPARHGEVVRYLNRLSDLFFQLARHANDGGSLDVLWKPGASREG